MTRDDSTDTRSPSTSELTSRPSDKLDVAGVGIGGKGSFEHSEHREGWTL